MVQRYSKVSRGNLPHQHPRVFDSGDGDICLSSLAIHFDLTKLHLHWCFYGRPVLFRNRQLSLTIGLKATTNGRSSYSCQCSCRAEQT